MILLTFSYSALEGKYCLQSQNKILERENQSQASAFSLLVLWFLISLYVKVNDPALTKRCEVQVR